MSLLVTRSTAVLLLLTAPMSALACGNDGDGNGDGGKAGAGDGGKAGAGDGGKAGAGDGGKAGAGDGGKAGAGDGVVHFTPPTSLSDRLADESQRVASLEQILENLCDPAFFRNLGQANDVGITGGAGLRQAGFSSGPGVETFRASAGITFPQVALSFPAGTAHGAIALSAGKMTAAAAVEFCFEGVVRPRVEFEGATYVVFTAETLFAVAEGECTTTPLGGRGNLLEACVATAAQE